MSVGNIPDGAFGQLPPVGMQETPSGLVVPKADPTREVWLKDDVKKFTRTLKFFHARGLTIIFGCQRCKEATFLTKMPSGDYLLECGCTQRELRRC